MNSPSIHRKPSPLPTQKTKRNKKTPKPTYQNASPPPPRRGPPADPRPRNYRNHHHPSPPPNPYRNRPLPPAQVPQRPHLQRHGPDVDQRHAGGRRVAVL